MNRRRVTAWVVSVLAAVVAVVVVLLVQHDRATEAGCVARGLEMGAVNGSYVCIDPKTGQVFMP